MFVTFIITLRWYFYQIMDYLDTRAYFLHPCIQEFSYKGLTKQMFAVIILEIPPQYLSTEH